MQLGKLLWRRVRKTGLLFGSSFVIVSLVVWLLERNAEGTHIVTLLDAMWLNVCTISTVGYGDTFPITTSGRIVMGAFILFTLVTIGFLLTAVNEAVIEVKRMEERGLLGTVMTDHIVVCGFGPVARTAIDELLAAGRDVAVICEEPDDFEKAQRLGPRANYFVTTGELNQEILKERLNAEQAYAGVVATRDDTVNIVASLNMQAVNPKMRIVVAVKTEAIRQTLVASGVTYVASPFELSGRLVASAAFEPDVARFIDDITSGIGGSDVQQYSAEPFAGKTVRDVRQALVDDDGPLLVAVAKWTEGSFEILSHPPKDLKLDKRDHLIVLANDDQLEHMREKFDVHQGR